MKFSLGRWPGILLALIIVFLVWGGTFLLVKRPFLPGPHAALASLLALLMDGRLGSDILASTGRVLLALGLAFFPAALLGIASGRVSIMDRVVTPLIWLFHPIPKVAFLPLILLGFGLGEASKVFLVILIVFTQIFIASRDAALGVEPLIVDAMYSMGAKKREVFFHAIIPAILPELFTAIRVSLGTAIAVLFMAETFATDRGMGWFIMDAWTRLAYTEMYAGILAIGIIGIMLFFILDLFEYILIPPKRAGKNYKNSKNLKPSKEHDKAQP